MDKQASESQEILLGVSPWSPGENHKKGGGQRRSPPWETHWPLQLFKRGKPPTWCLFQTGFKIK